MSKTGTFGLKFVTVPILARLLTPQEFSVVAKEDMPQPYMQVFVGAAAGGGIYGMLILATQRELPRKIFGTMKDRKAKPAVA